MILWEQISIQFKNLYLQNQYIFFFNLQKYTVLLTDNFTMNINCNYRFLISDADFSILNIQDFKIQNQNFSKQIPNFYKTMHIFLITINYSFLPEIVS